MVSKNGNGTFIIEARGGIVLGAYSISAFILYKRQHVPPSTSWKGLTLRLPDSPRPVRFAIRDSRLSHHARRPLCRLLPHAIPRPEPSSKARRSRETRRSGARSGLNAES